MTDTELANLTTTQMKTGVPNYSVAAKVLDEATGEGETYWTNPNWTTYLGYLKTIPEYRQAVRSLAIWTCGKGWTTQSTRDKIILEHITGWGEDSFDSIMQDMIVVKKTNGDAYAEIIRGDNKDKTLINLQKLNPSRVRIVQEPNGLILRYDVLNSKGEYKPFKVSKIFHICNDRIANENHGISVLESCKWIIDFKNELLSDIRRLMHRSSVRIIYVDLDNTTKLGTIRTEYKEAIKNGEVLILPGKKGQDFEVEQIEAPDTSRWLALINYVDNYFYEVLGVPKIITGGVQGTTEANAKVGYMTFEQPYMTEQRLLEQDIWNQLGIRITFNRPVSLKDEMQSNEAANTGQVGFQPNDAQVGMTRTG